MSQPSLRATRFTAWAAILGALFAILNIVFALMTSGDAGAILNGATMLGFASDIRETYRWAMLCDVLGFYLPFLIVGGYFWSAYREEAGVWGDMAALAIGLHVALGAGGAAMLQAALQPLAHLHAGGDEVTRAATEAAWTGLANGVEKGLWWCEGPVLLFWALVVGHHLKAAAKWRARMLQAIGVGYGLFFLFGFFPEAGDLTDLIEDLVVLASPVWMIWSGVRLLRQPAPAEA